MKIDTKFQAIQKSYIIFLKQSILDYDTIFELLIIPFPFSCSNFILFLENLYYIKERRLKEEIGEIE